MINMERVGYTSATPLLLFKSRFTIGNNNSHFKDIKYHGLIGINFLAFSGKKLY